MTSSCGNLIEPGAVRRVLTATVTDIFSTTALVYVFGTCQPYLEHSLLRYILYPFQELDRTSQFIYSETLIFIYISSLIVFHVFIFGIME